MKLKQDTLIGIWFLFLEKNSQNPIDRGVGPVGEGMKSLAKLGQTYPSPTSGARRRDTINTLSPSTFSFTPSEVGSSDVLVGNLRRMGCVWFSSDPRLSSLGASLTTGSTHSLLL